MATIVERMEAEADETASQPPAAPVVLDDATLERLVALLRLGAQPPARPAWQTSLLMGAISGISQKLAVVHVPSAVVPMMLSVGSW